MRVTLDIFSGRPNPTWKLTNKQAEELIDRVAGRSLLGSSETQGRLGFAGFVVTEVNGAHSLRGQIGQEFRIEPGFSPPSLRATGRAELRLDEAAEISRWLLGTAGKKVSDVTRSYVDRELRDRENGVLPTLLGEPTDPGPSFVPEGVQAGGSLEPIRFASWLWNTHSCVMENNNCYNYAMAWRSDSFAQPGHRSGKSFQINGPSVRCAAFADGCTDQFSGMVKIVALTIAPPGRLDVRGDYHWYLYHPLDGFWGHKRGRTVARNTDEQGRVIGGALNPSNCNLGGYDFFGYMFSPTGLQVTGPNQARCQIP